MGGRPVCTSPPGPHHDADLTCSRPPVPPLRPGGRGLTARGVLGRGLDLPRRQAPGAHLQLAGVLLMLRAARGGEGRAGSGAPPGQLPLSGSREGWDWPHAPRGLLHSPHGGDIPRLEAGGVPHGHKTSEKELGFAQVGEAGLGGSHQRRQAMPTQDPRGKGGMGPRPRRTLLRGPGGGGQRSVRARACRACPAELCGCQTQAHTGRVTLRRPPTVRLKMGLRLVSPPTGSRGKHWASSPKSVLCNSHTIEQGERIGPTCHGRRPRSLLSVLDTTCGSLTGVLLSTQDAPGPPSPSQAPPLRQPPAAASARGGGGDPPHRPDWAVLQDRPGQAGLTHGTTARPREPGGVGVRTGAGCRGAGPPAGRRH